MIAIIQSAEGELRRAKGAFSRWAEAWGREVGIGGVTVSTGEKNPDGSAKISHAGADDDLDAFRHAFMSAVLVAWQSFAVSDSFAKLLTDLAGQINEMSLFGGKSASPCAKHMDLHNNNKGRELAPNPAQMVRWITIEGKHPHREIAEIIADAIRSGELITAFNDPRMPKECHVDTKIKGRFFVWRTFGDEKVRWSHASRHGQVFGWKDNIEGGLPGEDFGCRCWAEPLDEKHDDDLEGMFKK